MLSRLAPLALVMLAACELGGSAANTPSPVAPQDLVRAVMESPGDGSDILEVLEQFESAAKSRRLPAGLVVSGRTLEAMARVPAQSRLIGTWETRYTPPEDVRVTTKAGLEKPREIVQHTFTFLPGGKCTTLADGLLDGGCAMDRGPAVMRADGVAEWSIRRPKTREYTWSVVRDEPAMIAFVVDDDERQTIAVDVVGPDELRGVDQFGSFRMVRVKEAK